MKLSQLLTSNYFNQIESTVENAGFLHLKTNNYSVIPILNIAYTKRVNYVQFKYYCSDFLYSNSIIKKNVSRLFVFLVFNVPYFARLVGLLFQQEMRVMSDVDVITFGNHRIRFHNIFLKNSTVVPFSTHDSKYAERCVLAYKEMSPLVNIPKIVTISTYTYVEDQLQGIPINRVNYSSFDFVSRFIESFLESNKNFYLRNLCIHKFSRYKNRYLLSNVFHPLLVENLQGMLSKIEAITSNINIVKSHGDLNRGNVYIFQSDSNDLISVIDWEFYSYRLEEYDHFVFFSNIRHESPYISTFERYCEKYSIGNVTKLCLLFEEYLFRSSNLGTRIINDSEQKILDSILNKFYELFKVLN